MSTTPEQILIFRSGLRSENPISCGLTSGTQIEDVCPEPGKFKALKMLDLRKKSAMKLVFGRVSVQATSRESQIIDVKHLS